MPQNFFSAWWEGFKELMQPGGYERRYARYHAQFSGSPPPPVPQQQVLQQSIPIDMEIQRVKLEIENYKLQLRQVNTQMTSTRSRYQQGHVHGGGKVGGFIRSAQRFNKDMNLIKQQPVKEQLQREKLAREQYLLQIKTLKAQGVQFITRK